MLYKFAIYHFLIKNVVVVFIMKNDIHILFTIKQGGGRHFWLRSS